MQEDEYNIKTRGDIIYDGIHMESLEINPNRKRIEPFPNFEKIVGAKIDSAYSQDKNSNLNLKNILMASNDIMQEQDISIIEHQVKTGDKPYNMAEFKISKELTDKQISDDLKDGIVSSYLLKIINDPKSLPYWSDRDAEKKRKQSKKAKQLRKESLRREKDAQG